jgi:hypothetical protein
MSKLTTTLMSFTSGGRQGAGGRRRVEAGQAGRRAGGGRGRGRRSRAARSVQPPEGQGRGASVVKGGQETGEGGRRGEGERRGCYWSGVAAWGCAPLLCWPPCADVPRCRGRSLAPPLRATQHRAHARAPPGPPPSAQGGRGGQQTGGAAERGVGAGCRRAWWRDGGPPACFVNARRALALVAGRAGAAGAAGSRGAPQPGGCVRARGRGPQCRLSRGARAWHGQAGARRQAARRGSARAHARARWGGLNSQTPWRMQKGRRIGPQSPPRCARAPRQSARRAARREPAPPTARRGALPCSPRPTPGQTAATPRRAAPRSSPPPPLLPSSSPSPPPTPLAALGRGRGHGPPRGGAGAHEASRQAVRAQDAQRRRAQSAATHVPPCSRGGRAAAASPLLSGSPRAMLPR